MLLQRKPCLFPVEERTEIICHQNLLWRLEIVALEPRWLFKEATIWKWPSHETGCCSNNMLVFCMKFFCSSFHLESSTVQKHKDCGWRTITGYHRGRHQVYGCNSQAATGGAIKYMVATYKLPQGAPSSMWLRLTGVHMGGTIVVPLEIKPLRGPHGIMVGRHLLLPIVIFFFLRGCSIPLSSRWRFRRLPVWPKPGANSGSFLTRGDVFESDKIWKMGIKTNRYHL